MPAQHHRRHDARHHRHGSGNDPAHAAGLLALAVGPVAVVVMMGAAALIALLPRRRAVEHTGRLHAAVQLPYGVALVPALIADGPLAVGVVAVKNVIAEFIQKQAVAGGVLFILADEETVARRVHLKAVAQGQQLFDGAGGGLRLGGGRRLRSGLLLRGHGGAAQGAELLRVLCQVGAIHHLLIHFTVLLAEAFSAHSYPL